MSIIIGNLDLSTIGIVTDVDIETPSVNTKKIEIPGRNGVIDATEALTGYPTYDNRTITISLVISGGVATCQSLYEKLASALHGQWANITFDFLPNYHYEGRIAVSVDTGNKSYWTAKITADCEPYAKKDSVTSKTIATGSLEVSSVMPTKLTIKATAQTSITRGGTTTTYSVGTHEIAYPLLVGTETLTINSGSGTIEWQEGKL